MNGYVRAGIVALVVGAAAIVVYKVVAKKVA